MGTRYDSERDKRGARRQADAAAVPMCSPPSAARKTTQAPAPKQQRTLENTRELDETVVTAEDEEVVRPWGCLRQPGLGSPN